MARLARGGLSNAEIGAPLFTREHSVAYHFCKLLAKLGSTSRNQLNRALIGSVNQVQV
jgi:DNA-binding NarL/FixJ family response regulator